jgi:hypothetical protein
MFRILGSPRKLCTGLTRRELLSAGGLSLFGLTLDNFLQGRMVQARPPTSSTDRSFGRAKACILLYLYGSPSQIETCDMKPDAPVGIRGEFRPIRSRLPGCDVCEHMPHTAGIMDRVTVVRSLNHRYPIHSISYALTGQPEADGTLDANPRDSRHWPFLGSVVDYLYQRSGDGKERRPVPDNIALPFPISSQRPAFRYAGFQPAFLGNGFAPVWTQFRGKATRHVVRPAYANAGFWEGRDPYLGIEPDGRFEVALENAATDLPRGRLDERRSLLDEFDRFRARVEGSAAVRGLSRHQAVAFSLLTSERMRIALDLDREPDRLRAAYGMTLFGQATLTARRLVEAGCRFVTVVWDEYGVHNTAWDTHAQHFVRMKEELLPGLDRAYASLIRDLEERGLLEETLVLCVSEHGRTPQVRDAPGGGRDHWAGCYTNWFAGGGIARGRVIGKSDKIGGAVAERPVSPKDILATVYHLLGFDPSTTLTDRLQRPVPLVANGDVVREMLA